jgi:hypothetical protein
MGVLYTCSKEVNKMKGYGGRYEGFKKCKSK